MFVKKKNKKKIKEYDIGFVIGADGFLVEVEHLVILVKLSPQDLYCSWSHLMVTHYSLQPGKSRVKGLYRDTQNLAKMLPKLHVGMLYWLIDQWFLTFLMCDFSLYLLACHS